MSTTSSGAERLASLTPEKKKLVEEALRRRREAAASGIPRRAEPGPAPLSFPQQRIWFLHSWEPDAPTFNGVRAIRIRGALDLDAMRRAFQSVVERHESLRTVFVFEGAEPSQVVLERWSLELPLIDLTQLDAAEREDELARMLRSSSREPFDLGKDLMIRTSMFRLGADDHVLLVRMHHIAADAFSDAVLFGEVAETYAAARTGREARLPDLPIQYADFAVWQRERLQGPRLDELVEYWTQELAGAPTVLRLPTDRPRQKIQRHEGARHELALSQHLADGVRELARAGGATVYMVLLGAFATLLYRLTGTDDVVVGSPIASRTDVELTPMIGFFCNTIALRTRLDGNPTFSEVCARVRSTALGAYRNQELPFDRVVDSLRVPRDPSYNPLFQVNFRAQDGAWLPLQLPGAETSLIPVDIGFSRFDLALELHVELDRISGFFEYDLDLFDGPSVARFADDLEALLEQVVEEPDTPILALRLPHGRRVAQASAGPRPRREQHHQRTSRKET
jgi:hypothetical protein